MSMTMAQRKLKAKHGTPNTFWAALMKAHDHLEITYQEAVNAIEVYDYKWKQAARKGG